MRPGSIRYRTLLEQPHSASAAQLGLARSHPCDSSARLPAHAQQSVKQAATALSRADCFGMGAVAAWNKFSDVGPPVESGIKQPEGCLDQKAAITQLSLIRNAARQARSSQWLNAVTRRLTVRRSIASSSWKVAQAT